MRPPPSAGIWRHHQITEGAGEYFEPKSHHPPGGARQKAAIYLTYHQHTPPHPHQEHNYHHFRMKLYELINFYTAKILKSFLKISTFSYLFWIFYIMYRETLIFVFFKFISSLSHLTSESLIPRLHLSIVGSVVVWEWEEHLIFAYCKQSNHLSLVSLRWRDTLWLMQWNFSLIPRPVQFLTTV